MERERKRAEKEEIILKKFCLFSSPFSTFVFLLQCGSFSEEGITKMDSFFKITTNILYNKSGCIRAKDEEFWNDSDDEGKEREQEERKF